MRIPWPSTPRASKAMRYAVAGVLAAIPAMWAIITDNSALGFVAVAIVLGSILIGPFVEKRQRGE